MSLDFRIMQEALTRKICVDNALNSLREILSYSDDYSYGKVATAYRVCRSLKDIGIRRNTWKDFCGNLRQAILFYNKTVAVEKNIYNSIKGMLHKFKLVCHNLGNENMGIHALRGMPNWFGKSDTLNDLYNLAQRRQFGSVIGDSFLYNFTGFKYYKSSTQKLLIQAAMCMPGGSTLLGCMPTGEGKSLVGLMPAFYENTGTTIIVVPTVSLAIDQSQNAKKLYKNRKNVPEAYHSELSHDEKEEIIYRLRKGDLPVLFISPEALLNSRFNNIVLENAKKGNINRLVIDEAHIVEDWGEQFRTEFQFLSVYRRKLLEVSGKKVKTILLSATYTDHCARLLKDLFSEGDNYIEIRGDALRAEIQYYIDVNNNNLERLAKLKEIILLLPRPIIIYVIKPDDADSLKEALWGIGFNSVATFTGNISSRTGREEILNKWNDNSIDIMVATSAFGMGVDKKDIRTVIHYCIPESINRFYQEVGRGGRDGAPSISLLLTMPSEDMKDALYIVNGKILTVEKFIDRWIQMKENIVDRLGGNIIKVNTDIKPSYIDKDIITGKTNASWNEYVLLQLFKNGFIDILDMEMDLNGRKLITIKIDNDIVDDIESLRIIIEEIRNDDIKRNQENISSMKDLAVNQKTEECMAERLKHIYRLTTPSCGGCNYCRNNDYEPDVSRNYTEYYSGKDLITNSIRDNSQSDYEEYFSIKNNLILNHGLTKLSPVEINIIINSLIRPRVNTIILKDKSIYEKIDFENIDTDSHGYCNIITLDELRDGYSDVIISGTVAVLYDEINDMDINKKLYEFSKAQINKNIKIIHILNTDIEIYPGIKLVNIISGVIRGLDFEGAEAYGL